MVKGYAYLATPFIYKKFGAETLGEYSLIITLSLFLAQFIALNATPVLLRASDNRGLMEFIASLYLSVTTLIFTIIFLIYIIWGRSLPDVIMLTLLSSASEALFIVSAAFYRGSDKYFVFFVITLLKVLSAIYFINFFMTDVESLVLFSSLISFVLSFLVFLNVYFISSENFFFRKNARFIFKEESCKSVKFGLQLLPHTVGLWGLNSGNKVFLGFISGAVALGLFSALSIYTFSIILVNSVLTLHLPREIVRNFSFFKDSKQDIKALNFYLLTVTVVIILTFIFIIYDNIHFFYIGSYSVLDLAVVLVMVMSYVNLGIYQFLSNYLFYHKKAMDISRNTLHTAVFSMILTTLLIYFFNMAGAALAFYVTSWFYVYVTHFSLFALNLEGNSALIMRRYLQFNFAVLVVSFIMFIFFWWLFC